MLFVRFLAATLSAFLGVAPPPENPPEPRAPQAAWANRTGSAWKSHATSSPGDPASHPARRLPDSPEGKRLAAFLEAAESGTEPAVRAFIEQNFSKAALGEMPVEPRLRRIHRLIAGFGPFELLEPGPPARDRATMRVRSKKNGRLFEISLELEEGPARSVLGVDVDEVPEDGGSDAPKRTDAELTAAVDEWVGRLAGKDSFSGVVLLARNGTPFFAKAWGLAERGLSIPNRVDTKFNVGSIGKAFTRAAVMTLVRIGRLSLDDTVARLLPGLRVPSAERITVGHLLEMTSGLGDIFGEKYDSTPKQRLRALSDFLPIFEGEPLKFEPGQGRAYSNAGYVVLGLIIEKISGHPYWDVVRETVFVPAEMRDTGPWGPDDVVANRAVGYTRTGSAGLRSNVYALPGRPSSAGGVDSTAGDLLRFVAAVGAGRVPMSASGGGPGQAGLGIAGGTEGANAVIESPGPAGVTVIVLANLDPPAAENVAKRIRRWTGGS